MFYSKYPVVLFMLFWIFLMHCSSRSTIIFLIVSKEIQKYDQKKFYFFSEKKPFQIWYSRSSLKKKLQKEFTIFSRTPKLQKKNSQWAKFRIKDFAKYIISTTSNTKEIDENIVKKIFVEIFLWKEKFSPEKSIVKIRLRQRLITKKRLTGMWQFSNVIPTSSDKPDVIPTLCRQYVVGILL